RLRKAIKKTSVKSFLSFWRQSLKESFNVGWAVFGILGTAMPAAITFLQRHYPTTVSGAFAKWVVENQVEIQLCIGGAFLLAYLTKSPYKHYKSEMLQMQS